MRFIYAAIACLTLLGILAGGRADAQDFKAGREYAELPAPPVLAGPDDGRLEVIAFFWYGCPHCHAVEPDINAWAAKLPPEVRLLRLPVIFNSQVEFHARLFFALESLKVTPEVHAKVFRIFQDEGRFINAPADLPGLAADLKIEPAALQAAVNSPETEARLADLAKLMKAYDLPGVPAMVVAGRYRFDIGTAHGPEGFIKLADFLVARELRERGSKPAAHK